MDKEVGETVTFPVWKRINDAEDIEPGTAMTSVDMEQKSSTATIKMIAAPGIRVYDYDNVVALVTQFRKVLHSKVLLLHVN